MRWVANAVPLFIKVKNGLETYGAYDKHIHHGRTLAHYLFFAHSFKDLK